MCEPDSVQYLRDLIQEKDFLNNIEGHTILKTLLDQGNHTCHLQLFNIFILNIFDERGTSSDKKNQIFFIVISSVR